MKRCPFVVVPDETALSERAVVLSDCGEDGCGLWDHQLKCCAFVSIATEILNLKDSVLDVVNALVK